MSAVVEAVLTVAAVAAVAVFAPEFLPAAFETVGSVAAEDIIASEVVMDAIAADPILVAAADAAPEVLTEIAANVAPEVVASAVPTADIVATALPELVVPETVTAVEQATAVLEATGDALATATTEQAAASTIVEAGGTVEQATAAVESVQEGATVSEAVSTATDGAVTANPVTEVASNSTSSSWQDTFKNLSESAKNLTKNLGETILPDADPMVQRFVGQTALNTATNGGDIKNGVESGILSLGTGAIGSEVAGETGSKLAGQIAGQAAGQLATTGTVNGEGLLTGAAGSQIGNFVGDETGSKFAGQAASTAARSLIAGKDPTQALENLGLKTLVNEGVGVAKDYASEFGKTLGFGSDTPADPNAAAPAEKADAIPTDVRDLIPTSTEVASPTSGAPTGGLAAVSSPDVTTADNATTAATLGQSGLGAMAPAASATDVGAIARAGASLAPPPDVTSEEPAPAGAPSAPPELPQQPAQPEAPQKNLFQQAAPLSPLGIMGAGVNKYLTGEVNQALRPTPQRPAAASGLKSAAPSRLTPDQMAQMRAGVSPQAPTTSAPAAPRQAPQFGPPKKANVANMTPITNVASLIKLLGKKG